ncbi:ankyrin repeat-containing protein [Quercus suber]|uniref:Ankyrin repeat-containing protein n=2 Tax=Quercus suber TaxID=58331 RepID=A0AAW0IVN8_QUESU
MKRVLDLKPSLLYKTNCEGNTALHIAASLGHSDMTKLLIMFANSQEVEMRMELLRKQNHEKSTALHEAIKYNHCAIVELLIREDPGLTLFTNIYGESPLFLAVDRRFYQIALHIIETVADCGYGGRKGKNVLHSAVINLAKSDFVHKMLEKFPHAILETDDSGRIPLHYAAHNGNVDVVELFLQKNDSVAYKTDNEGMSALHSSAKKGNGGVMRAIIKRCPYACELLDFKKSRTALHLAVESGSITAVNILLKELAFGDLINEKDKDGNTAFHLAAINRHYTILAMLAHDRRVDKLAMNEERMITADIVQLDNQLLRLEKKLIMGICNLKQVDGDQTPKEGWIIKIEGASDDQNISKEKEAEGASDDQDISKFSLTSITIITTVTFAAALQVPGGYNGQTGTAILQNNIFFKFFLAFDSFSFIASAAVMTIHFMNSMSKTSPNNKPKKMSRPINRSLGPLTYFCIYFMFFAYVMSMAAIMTGLEA